METLLAILVEEGMLASLGRVTHHRGLGWTLIQVRCTGHVQRDAALEHLVRLLQALLVALCQRFLNRCRFCVAPQLALAQALLQGWKVERISLSIGLGVE